MGMHVVVQLREISSGGLVVALMGEIVTKMLINVIVLPLSYTMLVV
jgi:hypothetical protein